MKISVVIVSYNSAPLIKRCLDSVLAQRYEDKEIIVVDNGSSDKSVEFIKACYSNVTLIENATNEGAAQARNQAIVLATGEWILTLDSDAYLEKDFLLAFAAFLEKTKNQRRMGIVVPKILYPDGKAIYSLGHRLTFLRRFYDVAHGKKDNGSLRRVRYVFGACAASAFYLRSMLSELGAFDKDIFFIAEDVDLAWRARQEGWRVSPCFDCISYHAGNSAALDENKRKYYCIRNRLIMMFKNDSRGRLAACAIFLFIYEIARLGLFLVQGKGGIYMSAISSAAPYIKNSLLKNKVKKTGFFLLFIVFIFFGLRLACAEEYKTDKEEASAYNVTRVTKTVDGLRFNVQEDRPIEKVAGQYRPLDMDAYIALKFNKLDKKIDELFSSLTERIEELSLKIEVLEKKTEELSKQKSASPINQTTQTTQTNQTNQTNQTSPK